MKRVSLPELEPAQGGHGAGQGQPAAADARALGGRRPSLTSRHNTPSPTPRDMERHYLAHHAAQVVAAPGAPALPAAGKPRPRPLPPPSSSSCVGLEGEVSNALGRPARASQSTVESAQGKCKVPEELVCRTHSLAQKYSMVKHVVSHSSSSIIQSVQDPHTREPLVAKCISVLDGLHNARGPAVVYRVSGMIPRTVEAVMQEARTLWLLRDVPSVVDLVEVLLEPGGQRVVLVMQALQGGTLARWMSSKKGGLTEVEAQAASRRALEALAALHGTHRQLAHHSLSLDHLVLHTPGRVDSVNLIDFAPSTLRDEDKRARRSYPAPELAAQHADAVNPQAGNMWTFGAMLMEMLPFRDEFVLAALSSPPWMDSSCAMCPTNKNELMDPRAAAIWYQSVQTWLDKHLQPVLSAMRTKGVRKDATDLMTKLLTVDPVARCTAKQALEHPWLKAKYKLPR